MIQRRWLGGVAALVLFAGCTGGDRSRTSSDPSEIVNETAANMAAIESGDLDFSLTATSEGELEGSAGFELSGPFSFEEDSLPTASWDFTRIAGEERVSVTFISADGAAFIEVDGQAYEVEPEQLGQLGASGGVVEGGLESLDIGDWIESPEISDGGFVGGAETDLIEGDLDVVAAVNGMLEIARQVSGDDSLPEITGEDAEQLEQTAAGATIELYTGVEDRLLRRLLVSLPLEAGAIEGLPEGLADMAATEFNLDLTISDPNSEISVEAPTDVLPFEELPQG